MLTISRRTMLQGAAAAAGLLVACPVLAQTPKKLAPKLRIVIPAGTRTGIDEAGRALGDAFVGIGVCDEVEYENRDGRGGLAGLAWYAEKYAADPNSLFMGDSGLVGSISLQKPAVDLGRLQPLARLTGDYLVVVVPAASPVKTLADLVERLRANPKQVPMAIGPAGGVDHLFAGLLAKSAGSRPEEPVYLSHARGFELVDAVTGGKAAAGIGAYGLFAPEIAGGKLRAIGVSSKKTAYGVRSAREQGIDIDITNWRAAFTGQAVAPARRAEMVEAIKASLGYELWKKTLKENYWEASWLAGPDLASFVDFDMKTALVMAQLLKLKA